MKNPFEKIVGKVENGDNRNFIMWAALNICRLQTLPLWISLNFGHLEKSWGIKLDLDKKSSEKKKNFFSSFDFLFFLRNKATDSYK